MTARRPDHLKLLAGTARADRAAPETAALPPIGDAPPAPDWLPNAFAANEWRRLAPVLVANKLLNDGNLNVFAQLCALHGRLVQLWTAGATPTAAMISAFRALSGELGLLSMSLPAAKPKNRFARHARLRRGER